MKWIRTGSIWRPQDWYENNTISVHNGRVSSIDRAAKTVNLENGDSLSWDQLVLTTGARARPLPDHLGGGAGGLYTLRGIADIEAMRDEFRPGRKLLVIGGGYIGLEAAAIARKLGLEVTVIEAAPRILGRVASPATADHIRSMHQDHGVIIREGMGIEDITTTETAAGHMCQRCPAQRWERRDRGFHHCRYWHHPQYRACRNCRIGL